MTEFKKSTVRFLKTEEIEQILREISRLENAGKITEIEQKNRDILKTEIDRRNYLNKVYSITLLKSSVNNAVESCLEKGKKHGLLAEPLKKEIVKILELKILELNNYKGDRK